MILFSGSSEATYHKSTLSLALFIQFFKKIVWRTSGTHSYCWVCLEILWEFLSPEHLDYTSLYGEVMLPVFNKDELSWKLRADYLHV